jgi:hypothetical protein
LNVKRKILESSLNLFDVKIDRSTKKRELETFFKNINPISTNHKLIRLGNENDGGYLVPDDMAGVKTCFSPGVSDVADFELDLTKRGIKCFLIDYSVDSPPISGPLISFEKKFLGDENGPIYTTLESWVDKNAAHDDHELLLQMDIEGSEYDVLIDASHELLRRFRIIVIEFHHLHGLLSPVGFKLIKGVFAKILRSFEIVHIHPNNYWGDPIRYREYEIPKIMEFTFLRKDRISNCAPSTFFPHPLDRPNLPFKPDFPLPSCWQAKI